MGGEVQKLVVVVSGVESKDVLERWVFDIQTDKPGSGKYVIIPSELLIEKAR